MPRFAILRHDHPFVHWDLLLEHGEAAWTWRLLAEPQAGEIPAQRIADHRLMYLDYNGPVSGNRGTVSQWDVGEYEILETGPPLSIVLHGGQSRLLATIHANAVTMSLAIGGRVRQS